MFKVCTNCGRYWASREIFLSDPQVAIIGYQAALDNLLDGLYLFNHSCGTTVAVKVDRFYDLIPQVEIFKYKAACSLNCTRQCLDENNLELCPESCEGGHLRRVLDAIKNWEKK